MLLLFLCRFTPLNPYSCVVLPPITPTLASFYPPKMEGIA